MALSKYILDIGEEIERKSGVEINFSRGTTRPTKKWIEERVISTMKAIHLRSAEETKNESVMILQQFNPSVLLKDSGEIHCRIPGCSSTTRRLKSSLPSEKIKQDLFLCDIHRATLTRALTKRCAEENVTVNAFKHEDFSGYTNLIGELDKAFTSILKKSYSLNVTNNLLAEVLLNTRNFLIITNALLNPDEDNTITVLSSYMSMFQSFLSHLGDLQVKALKDIMNMVLLSFGVVYGWVFLANPGARVGAGVGILLGFVGALAYTFPPAGILAFTVVGLAAGNLIGGGLHDWSKDHQYIKRQQQMIQEYQKTICDLFGHSGECNIPLISAHGNAAGGLAMEPPKRD